MCTSLQGDKALAPLLVSHEELVHTDLPLRVKGCESGLACGSITTQVMLLTAIAGNNLAGLLISVLTLKS